MRASFKKRLVTITILVSALLIVGAFIPFAEAQAINSSISGTAVATTSTCTLYGVGIQDVIVVAASSTQAVSTVASSPVYTFTAQASSTLATATVASQTYIYTATATARGTVTVTVTWASSANSIIGCFDTVGWSATAAHSSTGSGALSGGGNSISPSVVSYSPTAGNLELSVYGGSTCGGPATITGPASTSGHFYLNQGATGTSCLASPSTNFYWTGGIAWYQSASGSAQTDGYSATGTQTVGTNTADWTEAAADFTANTVKSQSLTETLALGSKDVLRSVLNTEPMALFSHSATPQPVNIEPECLGVAVTVNAVQTLNTGPVCQITSAVVSVLTTQCNFGQLQCWAYPLMFLGMYDAFFIAAGLAFRFSEKGFIYFTMFGAALGSLIESMAGFMTPFLPVALIVLLIASALRLDRVVSSRI